MELALLLDIGSTYTKGTVVDLDKVEIKATAKALTTVKDDINIGLKNLFKQLEGLGISLDSIEHRLACSSAAGGLEMVAVGLVPDLTAEAARRAALGAGAKVAKVYSYELTDSEVEEIIKQNPDVVLLAGGTDGGNQDTILHNAKMLATSELNAPIIVAGNKVVADDVKSIIQNSNKEAYITKNVMPKLEELNIEPARKRIRELFLDKIIYAKGLARVEEYIERVVMPTPSAVMKAAELIAEGTNEEGLGELMIVDIGGATTDIHSVAVGRPTKSGVNLKGLEEPYVKRTVEGDLGMRYSASSLIEAIDKQEILTYLPDRVDEAEVVNYINKINEDVDYIPDNELERELDAGLAKVATKLAIERHVGKIEVVYTPFGESYVQYGKDLTDLNLMIGTGGILVHSEQPGKILKQGLFNEDNPTNLAPKKPKLMLDKEYILASIGLLAEISLDKAFQLAKKHLKEIGGEIDEIKE
ncbi:MULTISPECIES: methylaspartate mutase accessory protein GlmL [unclassified Candidatus Frackibacter]|uniref:methylaspartate mutase accessory protein GlmL n=1 Tax=unclassified Candidatus Frackibacter TaxID=2648818 RepID=UPI000794EF27|nr:MULTISPECIES: methylaspartate mutase accessory protein GlmL [unclassified Candidatus Frackibacter]KXS43959.1 MAG: hypothetical protein AWU54_859 [Candidatus Frackibacter sp. T328-2]SDC75495.1 conserved hypothetical protein [Candidatus Frackibacter sp. WG11]SEM89204.1 conserved hypothetical protein [Candidatus Frackibacter sp. WG12]SFL98632.1 conserved hypothetical protein [Candidatus Frackibacter sp. WG13]